MKSASIQRTCFIHPGRPCIVIAAGLACLVLRPAMAESPNSEALAVFENHIRPTLVEQCIRCHGPKKQQGGLRLDSAAWIKEGGESGDLVAPGAPEKSLLIDAITYKESWLEMPPKGRLPEKTIQAFKRWVKLGAIDPRISTPESDVKTKERFTSIENGRQFWSFKPVTNSDPPRVIRTDWPKSDIDHFVLSRLEDEGLVPAQSADKRTLLRRAYYDLVGLPPTPKEIDDFLNDESPQAFSSVVDRLLESREFGQRWGRHWLDVVRFAESSGGGRTLLFPNAWRYRDYVIDAFNDDLPYDQFLMQQLAGDLLTSDDWQQRRQQLTATAFLLLGPTNYELQDKDVLEMDVVDEQLDTIGKSLLGMTIGCARCHDHKFDPLPARDYYALAGILKSTKAMIHSNVSTWNKVELPVDPELEAKINEKERQIAATTQLIQEAKQELKKLGGMPKGKAKRNSGSDLPSAQIKGIVIDDEQATLVGAWTPSTSIRPYVDGKYVHDGTTGKGEKSVVFPISIEKPGVFDVRIVYSPQSNRSSNVPVHIHHTGGETTVKVDQKVAPDIDGTFKSLGVFKFDPAQDPRVVISTEGTQDGVVIADTVVLVDTQIVPLPTPDQVDIPENIAFVVQDKNSLDGIVVDDVDARLNGKWHHSVHTPPFVGASYIHDMKEGKGEKSATFTPDLPQAGMYEVRVSHNTNVRRASHVPIVVKHAAGETTVHINEDEPAPIKKLFRSIGQYQFDSGSNGSVTIKNDGTDGKYVIVDAVQFIFIGNKAKHAERLRQEIVDRIKSLETQLKTQQRKGPSRPIAMVTADDEDAGDIHLAIRGVVHNQGPMIPRGVMQVVTDRSQLSIPSGESGRRELAQWITDPKHPLTARVMANRVWYWLMDRGIVKSVDNFGTMGDLPTHPALLDHLAHSFVQNNWSVKSLIRQIMNSRVYQMSTQSNEENAAIDPDNRLLWRMNRKRLRAEDIRDTLLMIGGNLDATFGGPNMKAGTKSEYGYKFQTMRRSVYVPVFRNTLPEIFEVFDFADPNIQRGSRTSSTIASQALLMMNHPFVIKQSNDAASRLIDSKPVSQSLAIDQVYEQVLGRLPTPKETAIAEEFIRRDEENDDQTQRWAMLYQALFGCVDFRYLN